MFHSQHWNEREGHDSIHRRGTAYSPRSYIMADFSQWISRVDYLLKKLVYIYIYMVYTSS